MAQTPPDAVHLPLWGQHELPHLEISNPEEPPELIVRLAPESTANGAAVVVCPGGGYGSLAMDHEGYQIADWLNANGISAFIVTYRRGKGQHHPIPIEDAQRALRTVRHHAQEWGVDPTKIGILGFSAGGHLATSTGIHFDHPSPVADAIGNQSARPDFMILLYPVITFTREEGHKGSRKNLLGETPDPALVEHMSLELQAAPESTPAFLVHTSTDRVVPPHNSLWMYEALVNKGVEVELHIFEEGRHGLGLGDKNPELTFRAWPELCLNWLRAREILE
jgi:acetyl esterase/lipase